MDTLEIGKQAELRACSILEANGLKLLARNYHSPFGEIDLIMRDQEEVVFVEVRERSPSDFASALESVTKAKQRKIIKTAMHYLQKLQWFDKVHCRFDVVAFDDDKTEWVKDAFRVEY